MSITYKRDNQKASALSTKISTNSSSNKIKTSISKKSKEKEEEVTVINDPQYNREYLMEMYQNLLSEEKELKSLYGYIKCQTDINEKMRAILIDWIIEVHFKFKLCSEALFLCIWIIDMYLSMKIIKRRELQLLGVTALLISCKYEEIYSPEIFDFVYITENTYQKKEIIDMEFAVLKLLQFNITVPTSNRFYEIISTVLRFSPQEYYLGKYLLELFLIDYRSLKFKPSEIANTICFLITNHRDNSYYSSLCDGYDSIFMVNYRNNEQTYKDCTRDICFILEYLDSTQLLTVKKKYMKQEFYRVGRVRNIFN